MPHIRGSTKAQQREDTTRTLIATARAAFTAHGYAQTATEDICREAGVTRGALYHYFGDKTGLFRAVLQSVSAEIAARIDEATSGLDDTWSQLTVGCEMFLEAAISPAAQRIFLIDGPSVLGWQAWREIDESTSMRGLADILAVLRDSGEIAPLPIEALAHLLSGAMNEAALWIAQAADKQAALDDARAALSALLDGLRVR